MKVGKVMDERIRFSWLEFIMAQKKISKIKMTDG